MSVAHWYNSPGHEAAYKRRRRRRRKLESKMMNVSVLVGFPHVAPGRGGVNSAGAVDDHEVAGPVGGPSRRRAALWSVYGS